jgi:hypothetical protein
VQASAQARQRELLQNWQAYKGQLYDQPQQQYVPNNAADSITFLWENGYVYSTAQMKLSSCIDFAGFCRKRFNVVL